MIIIIDGYNFLKAIAGTAFVAESVINEWMATFGRYMAARGNTIKVVFDAGPSTYQSSEWYGAVEVFYAGQYQTADDLLKVWLSKNRGLELLLVTSDREIRNHAKMLGLISISSQDFYKVFNDVMRHEDRQLDLLQQTVYKTKLDDENDSFLDDLMEQGSRNLVPEVDKNEYDGDVRVRDGKKASREDRSVMKKVDKI